MLRPLLVLATLLLGGVSTAFASLQGVLDAASTTRTGGSPVALVLLLLLLLVPWRSFKTW